MKGNDGTGNIVERDAWSTPEGLFEILNDQYDFEFDCCGSENNRKCEFYHDDFECVGTTEASINDDVVCWMNPPFSKAYEMFKHFFDVVTSGVCIYRCDNMETKIWQDMILKNADWVFIPKGRISYEGMEGKGSRFPSALIGFNVEAPKDIEGTTLFLNKESQE